MPRNRHGVYAQEAVVRRYGTCHGAFRPAIDTIDESPPLNQALDAGGDASPVFLFELNLPCLDLLQELHLYREERTRKRENCFRRSIKELTRPHCSADLDFTRGFAQLSGMA